MARMRRISFGFRAKLSYYHAKNIRFFAVIRPPDHSRLLCMCNGLALVIHQTLQYARDRKSSPWLPYRATRRRNCTVSRHRTHFCRAFAIMSIVFLG